MTKTSKPAYRKDGVISRQAVKRLALRDDVCCNCGDDGTQFIGEYMVCESPKCAAITRRIVKEKERGKGGET